MMPTKIKLHKQSRILELEFGAQQFQLSAEYLRTHSPSAEVKGHGAGQEKLQFGKKDVGISALERAGNYALKIIFDDGHDSGIFTWAYLYDLALHHQEYWEKYLDALTVAGKSRDKDTIIVKFI